MYFEEHLNIYQRLGAHPSVICTVDFAEHTPFSDRTQVNHRVMYSSKCPEFSFNKIPTSKNLFILTMALTNPSKKKKKKKVMLAGSVAELVECLPST